MVALRFKVTGTKLEVWQGDILLRTTTINALVDAATAIQRGRTEVVL